MGKSPEIMQGAPIEVRYLDLQFEIQKNPATPNFEQIYVDVLPKCRFSQS